MDITIGRGLCPDLSDLAIREAGGLKTANNVVFHDTAYRPVFGPTPYNSTPINESTAGKVLAHLVLEASDLIRRNYLFLSKKIYRYNDASFDEISCYPGEVSNISVATYGDWIIITDGQNQPKILKNPDGNSFADLGGSPPKAKYVFFNNGHLILANLIEGSTSYPKRIRWSARENIEDWAESLTTGADYQDFPDNLGAITGIGSLGDSFAIFFSDSISLGVYSGGIYTFSFKHNAFKNIGCPYPKSIVSVGNAIYFWGRESIYKLSADGLVDIAHNRVKRYVFDNFNKDQASQISAIFDYRRGLIFWGYVSSASQTPDIILVYNILEDCFTTISLSHKALIIANQTASIDLDQDDRLVDSYNILVDSDTFYGATIVPMVVDKDGYIGYFGGDMLEGEIELPELETYPEILVVKGLKIRGSGPISGQVEVNHRYSHNDSKSLRGNFSLRNDLQSDFMVSDRLLSLKVKLSEFNKIFPYLTLIEQVRGKR